MGVGSWARIILDSLFTFKRFVGISILAVRWYKCGQVYGLTRVNPWLHM
jgi:hypothetical protein